MRGDQIFQFLGTDLLAAAVDIVLDAAFERIADDAVYFESAKQIAGAEETIRRERGFVRFRIGEIADQRARTAEGKFADLAEG